MPHVARRLPPGVVVITALASLLALSVVGPVPAQAATSYHLMVSSSATRASAHGLSGHTIAGKQYVFLSPATGVKKVSFYVDDKSRKHKPLRTDSSRPFDLVGGSATTAVKWPTTALRDGTHTLTAVIGLAHGKQKIITVSFKAANPTPKPKSVTAAVGDRRVTLTWVSGGAATKGFNVYRSTTSTIKLTKPLNGAKPLTAKTLKFVDKTAKNGTTYRYLVQSVSTRHKASSSSRVVATPFAPPKTPTNVKSRAGDAQLRISWSTGGGDTLQWRVYRGATTDFVPTTANLVTTLAATARSFTDTGLTDGQTYYYVVEARHGTVVKRAAAVPGTPIPAPIVSAPVGDDQTLNLAWQAGSGATAIVNYHVQVSTAADFSGATTLTTAATARTLAVSGLENDQQYYVRVLAVDANAGSAASPATTGVPIGPPVAPAGVQASASTSEVDLTWTAGANTTGFNVFRSTSTTVSTTGTPLNGSTALDSGITSFSDMNVSSNTTYHYVVQAVGPSRKATSAAVAVTTPKPASIPSVGGWGALQPTNTDWSSPVGVMLRGVLGPKLTNLRFVFNRIGDGSMIDKTNAPTPTQPDPIHVKPIADAVITNTSSSPITVNSIATTGPYSFTVFRNADGNGGAFGSAATHWAGTIPAGGAIRVHMQFDFCRATCSSTAAKGAQYGTLVVNSNDPGHGTASVLLAGGWQRQPKGGSELSLATWINQVLGIQTVVATSSRPLYYGGGRVVTVGDEVLAPYFNRADPTKPVAIRQIVATHNPGSATTYWNPKGTATQNALFTQTNTDWQTALPGPTVGAVHGTVDGNLQVENYAEASFSPTTPFALRIVQGGTIDWTDDTKNNTTHDVEHGCMPATQKCGHHIRVYPVKDADGHVVPNTYLVADDLAAVNLDFQDIDLIITNVTPAAS